MVAKPQIEEGARSRAGMPLARAQRLSDKATARERNASSPVLLVVLAVVATLGGGAFLMTSGAETPQATTAVAASLNPTSRVDPSISDVEPVSADAVTPTVPAAARPALSPCIERIETHLRALHRADTEALAWNIKRERIRAAAQSALNCDGAGVSFAGDFELTATDFADLQVRWDRAKGHLTFTIIDSVAPDASELVLTDDGQPIAFIVH